MNLKILFYFIFYTLCLKHIYGQAFITDVKIEHQKEFFKEPISISNAIQTVNQFTGDVSLSYPLVNLPGKNGLDLNLSLQYSSNIHHLIGMDNEMAPTGWVGLGWSLDIGKITADRNGTVDPADDRFYYQSSNGTVEIKSKGSNFTYDGISYMEFKLENDPFVKVGGQPANPNGKWVMIFQDGKKFYFSETRKLKAWKNWIGHSNEASDVTISYGWDLQYIENIYGNRIEFTHEIYNAGLLGGGTYTKECYLKQITDTYGRKIIFNLSDKLPNESIDMHSEQDEPDAYQEIFETKYLSSIQIKDAQNNSMYSYSLNYDQTKFVGTGNSQKRLLTSITKFDKFNTALPSDYFSYKTANPNKGALSGITYGSGSTVSYNYSNLSIAKSKLDLQNVDYGTPGGYSLNSDDRWRTKVYTGNNYVVIGNHDAGDKRIHIWAYYWVGKWIGGYLASIPTRKVKWDLDSDEGQWFDKNNEIICSNNFFVVHTNDEDDIDDGRDEAIYIWYWDKVSQQWKNSYGSLELKRIGDRQSYSSGEDWAAFYTVAVGNNYACLLKKNGLGTLTRFTFNNNQWTKDEFNVTADGGNDQSKDYYLFGHRDYFIVRNDDYNPQDRLTRYWLNRNNNLWQSSYIHVHNNNDGGEKPKVVCGDFFIIAFLQGTNDYLYYWNNDGNWNTAETQLPTSVAYDAVRGTIVDNLFYYIQSDLYYTLRVNGIYGFSTSDDKIKYNTDLNIYNGRNIGLGNNYYSIGSFDMAAPNGVVQWVANSNQFSEISGFGTSWHVDMTSFDMFSIVKVRWDGSTTTYYDDTKVYKWTGTEWLSYLIPPITGALGWVSQGNKYYVLGHQIDAAYGKGKGKFYYYKDNAWSQSTDPTFSNIACVEENKGSVSVGLNTIAFNSKWNSTTYSSDGYSLFRIGYRNITGNLNDYPCTSITLNDGLGNVTTWSFTYENGFYEPSNIICQYNKTTVTLPDNNGTTETYFFNGLANSEVNNTFPTEKNSSNMGTMYTLMTGQPYRVNTYEQSNTTPITETVNYFKAEKLDNTLDIWVVRPVQQESYTNKSGLSKVMTTKYTYDPDNAVPGAIVTSIQEDNKTIKNAYTVYAAKVYSDMRNNYNMLTQVYENYTKIDNLHYSDSWTVYEQKTVNGKTAYLPTKNRSWIANTPSSSKPTYSLSYPGADVSYDAAGNVFETYNIKANGYSCNIYLSNTLPIASFSNTPLLTSSKYNVIADEFGDGSIADNSPLSWTTATGWSVVNGELKADNSEANALKAVPAVNMTNFNAEFDLKIYDDAGNGANYGGLEFRKTSQSHTFENSGYIVYLKANGLIGLYKNGSTIQEVQTGITSKKAHIKITGQGSSIKVFADGKQFITATDASFNGNYLGFRINGAKCWFDNLVVYPLDASYTLQSYDPSTFDVLYKIDANGQKVSYEYDTLGRLIRVRGPNGEILKEVNYKLSSEQ